MLERHTAQDCGSESFATLYSLVVYRAGDVMPAPTVDCYGPFRNPLKFLQLFDKLDFSGGHAEFHAMLTEGLATALHCFKDLAHLRDPGLSSQKFCVLVCNSPPYTVPVADVPGFKVFLHISFPSNRPRFVMPRIGKLYRNMSQTFNCTYQ